MFLSLLAARRFRGKVFALLVIIISGVIAFFSVGIPSCVTLPEYHRFPSSPKSGVLLENPLPLSFPIHSSLSLTVTFSSAWQDLQLYFTGLQFHAERIFGVSHMGGYWLDFSLVDYANFFSFFMLINVVGSVFGYWLSRRASIDRLSKPVKRVGPALIAIALIVTSVYLLSNAYQFWSGYNWAMWRWQISIPIGESGASLLSQLELAIWRYKFLFPVYFFVGLIFGTFALMILARNSRRRALIIAATAMVSSALLFFETYRIWEIYNLDMRRLGSSLAYVNYARYEANYLQTLFWLYLLTGSIAVASGIVLMSFRRLKAKMQAYMLKREQSKELWFECPTGTDSGGGMKISMRTVMVAIIVVGCFLLSLHFFVSAYSIWSRYNWAMWRLQYPILFVGSSALYPQLSLAISQYVGVFPSYFVTGLLMLTLSLATLAISSRKTTILIALIVVSGAILLGEAYKIWEIYMWSNLQTTTPPLSYYSNFRGTALASYENLFWLSIQIGVLEVGSGLASAGIRLRGRFKDRPKEPILLLDNNEKTKKRQVTYSQQPAGIPWF